MSLAEFLSGALLLALLALFLRATGTPSSRVVLLLVAAAIGIFATAMAWEFLESHE
jgi:hypothetical protein